MLFCYKNQPSAMHLIWSIYIGWQIFKEQWLPGWTWDFVNFLFLVFMAEKHLNATI